MVQRQSPLESVGVTGMTRIDVAFWQGKRVLLTGHTGFKGSWLSLWLQSLGAEVVGLALVPPTTPALFREADVARGMRSIEADIRDESAVKRVFADCHPELVIHMAAQPLVRLSYAEPVQTYATNVMGTVHVLEAARQCESVRAVLNVTSDKCYENREWAWGYRENEAMGGFDPYSNSKGCAELVTSAYRQSFYAERGIGLGSARSGNVIGGGDWATDRLVPDILRAFEDGQPVVIRSPRAVRPWQHVLEPLSGYLQLAQQLYLSPAQWSEGWNFGPREDDAWPVLQIVEHLATLWGEGASWRLEGTPQPHEANFLRLDIAKVRTRMGWTPQWSLDVALDKIVEWHRAWQTGQSMRDVCLHQIQAYQAACLSKDREKTA